MISSGTLSVNGQALREAGRTRMLVASLTDICQEVGAEDLGGLATGRRLYETNVMEAMSSHELYRAREGDLSQTRDGGLGLCLLPHSVVRIDTA